MNIFYDSYGVFQWASIAAIVAGFGAMVSFIFSLLSYFNSKKTMEVQKEMDQKKIDADIISKSRMHWIDNTKILTTTFLTDSVTLASNYKMFVQKIVQLNGIKIDAGVNLERSKNAKLSREERDFARSEYTYWMEKGSKVFNQDMEKRAENINELLKSVTNNFMLIKLNFSDNEENNRIVNLAFEISEELRNYSLNSGWDQFASENQLIEHLRITDRIWRENSKKADQLTVILRDYYKKEWEKVKKGE
ncbi:hypothetical protein JZO70_10300 [Enterococcus sp. 669A]|uniref:Phage protein n=1 Tax=Candidatus Enterococcus moelleringii TaxID=2815325 RepID=A0ABS3LBV8_9ENTE|nr:hypothetical protein [Enterococcus sp. 669A]MBO1306555.1 hypothetical protein [Enterococcus sp. 669A]